MILAPMWKYFRKKIISKWVGYYEMQVGLHPTFIMSPFIKVGASRLK
jgi:hypothetical protein